MHKSFLLLCSFSILGFFVYGQHIAKGSLISIGTCRSIYVKSFVLVSPEVGYIRYVELKLGSQIFIGGRAVEFNIKLSFRLQETPNIPVNMCRQPTKI